MQYKLIAIFIQKNKQKFTIHKIIHTTAKNKSPYKLKKTIFLETTNPIQQEVGAGRYYT